jgi:hypothetical protein
MWRDPGTALVVLVYSAELPGSPVLRYSLAVETLQIFRLQAPSAQVVDYPNSGTLKKVSAS